MHIRILNSNTEEVIWSSPITKGFFKITVVQERQITNLRVIQGEGYVGLQLLEDIVVMNQHRVSDSNYSSFGGRGYARFGTGKSQSRTAGDIAFIYQGKPHIIFREIPDPQGVVRLAKSARKTLIENKMTAEKMNKARLQEQQNNNGSNNNNNSNKKQKLVQEQQRQQQLVIK
jgi:hypothetical protein